MVTAADIDLGDGLFAPIEIDQYLALYTNGPLASRGRYWLRDLLINRDHQDRHADYTFGDLISAFTVATLRDQHVSMQRIRTAHATLREMVGRDRPMAHRGLYTDGEHIFVDLGAEGQLTNLTSSPGQEAGRNLLELHLDQVSFDDAEEFQQRRASRWWPAPGVSVSPRVLFGAPCVGNRRLTTSAVAEMVGEGFSMEEIEQDYGLSELEVRQATDFEERLAAIAA